MKRTITIAFGIAFALFGSMISSGAVHAGLGLIVFSGIFAAGFGAVGALAYLGGRPDYATRIGTVVILFLGGIAVFASRETALVVVPSATAGLLLGFAACLAFLGLSEG
jgi:hypothetical protein